MKVIDTADTTRLLGVSPIDFNIYVTRMIYPSSKVAWRPNAVILVPLTTYHYGLIASPIIHFPINAPIMFTNPYMLAPETLSEIIRLSPTGKNAPAKIIIIGPVYPLVENTLQNAGFSTFTIERDDPFNTAGEVLELRYQIPSASKEGNENIMLVSGEDYSECLHAAYFSAHMGVPFLFTYKNELPQVTRQKLQKYNTKNVFIIGSEHTVSNKVFNEVAGIVNGKVDRVAGNTPVEAAINFARYYSSEGMFGWNINRKDGWAFCFGNPTNWPENLVACIFAHLGKHSPLLYTYTDQLPKPTGDYVLSLNPIEKHPPQPPFMHGYILGGYDKVSFNTQVELEEVLIAGAGR